jgi:hypothetical protein
MKRLILVGLTATASISAIADARLEFQGWGGVNIATKSTFASDFTGATIVKPTFGITTWASQPWLSPQALDVGLSFAYMPVFTQTSSDNKENSITAYPITLEARYRLPYNLYAAAGGGYALTRLKINGEGSNTNSAIALVKGGYQHEVIKNVSVIGELQISYLMQKLTFPGSLEKSNSQLNFGFHLGVAYKL